MTDARRDEPLGDEPTSVELTPDIIEQRLPDPIDDTAVEPQSPLDDPEVPEVDARDQALPVDPDDDLTAPRLTVQDPEMSDADAWEQSLPVDVFDDY